LWLGSGIEETFPPDPEPQVRIRLLPPLSLSQRGPADAVGQSRALAGAGAGAGKTKTGRLWTYVRDERPFGGPRPPAALFFYSADCKDERPQAHLKEFRGVIHADGYAGFYELFAGGRIFEVGCWAHVRATERLPA
jgi:hypothetical protein